MDHWKDLRHDIISALIGAIITGFSSLIAFALIHNFNLEISIIIFILVAIALILIKKQAREYKVVSTLFVFAVVMNVGTFFVWTPNTSTAISASIETLSPSLKAEEPKLIDIHIRDPKNSTSVPHKKTVFGTALNVPNGQQLWIAIYPQTELVYYPNGPIFIQEDGNWTESVQFGGVNDAGTNFDIIPFLADENAQKNIDVSLKKSEAIKELPYGTTEYQRVTVIRAND